MIGKLLTELRIKRGLTQDQIADALDVKRPRYNSWENDIAKPDIQMLKKIAKFHDVSPNYLLSFEANKVSPSWATTKDKRDFKKMLEDDGDLMFDGVPIDKQDRVRVMDVLTGLFWEAKQMNKRKKSPAARMTPRSNSPGVLSIKGVRIKMDKLITTLVRRYKTNCPFTIAEKLNIHIRFADLGNHTRGIYYCKLRRRFIVINSGINFFWQRFICAHELAHDRLHRGLNRFFLDEHSLQNANKYERQANMFAVQLLSINSGIIPGETIEQLFMRTGIPYEMAQYYKEEDSLPFLGIKK